ncbi:MerR family transcriptional regulator [Paenibacillus turpanensis]|uniref:MerR family transcriptional regulator n=1 Tax=Paenibacillus turpanensis TaxID=2689078 RepID=UPI001FB74A28|nr:MerR family transcriptional regulator [Paenibacillus turpanensis]
MNMKNKFSVGEMAKLHNTSIKTLRYYDEVGLLKPMEVDTSNGYRYYSTEQFEQLNTIHYLKELGFSLKEIKRHLDHRDLDGYLHLLEKQKQLTENKIRDLERMRQRFQNRIQDIKQARQVTNIGEPSIVDMEERVIVRLMEKISSDPELEVSLRNLENLSNRKSSIYIGGVGLTISMEQLKIHKFDQYNSIFILTEEEDIQGPFVDTFPKGRYASISFRASHHNSAPYYGILLEYMKANGFEMKGDAIERTIIDHYISNRPEDYLTEIQIPVTC